MFTHIKLCHSLARLVVVEHVQSIMQSEEIKKNYGANHGGLLTPVSAGIFPVPIAITVEILVIL